MERSSLLWQEALGKTEIEIGGDMLREWGRQVLDGEGGTRGWDSQEAVVRGPGSSVVASAD